MIIRNPLTPSGSTPRLALPATQKRFSLAPARWGCTRNGSGPGTLMRNAGRGLGWAVTASLAVTLLAGCQRKPGPDVVATVNGHSIMRSELEAYYRANLGSGKQPSQEQAEATRLGILRQLIDQEILQQRATKLHLVATDEEVDAKITEMKAPYTEEEFKKKLSDSHMSIDDLKREVRRNLTADKLLNKEIMSRINITDSDISNYYNNNKSLFNFIEPKYHIAEIVVTTRPARMRQGTNLQNSKAGSAPDALKKIEMLHNRLESGDDFATVAMNFSENPNDASNGGDMGLIPESALRGDPAVYDAISKLRPGQMTGIVPLVPPGSKAPAEYAIYKLLEIEPAGQRELKDPRVQQDIRRQLRESRAQLLRTAYYEMLRNEAHVTDYLARKVFKDGAQ